MTAVELGDPAGRERFEVVHDGRRFLVLRHEARWMAVDALCPHRQGVLADGVIRGDELVCPSHWYTFDLRDGTCRTSPDFRLGVYPVEETATGLVAEIPDLVRRSWSEVLHAHAHGR